MKYYTLLIREDARWAIHFGAFNKPVVQQELEDVRDGGTKGKDLLILTTKNATQNEIDAQVAALNARHQG